jgi:aspartate/methionine/tyrosine aminotransferase
MDGLKEAADKCDAKAVIVINPNNPTGSYVSGSERIAIINLCAERGMALIADEVFFQFALETNAGRARFAGEQGCLCFALDGLSKLLCLPQLKLGWMRISGPEAEVSEAASRLEFVADAYLSAGAPVMNALPSLLGKVDVFGDSVRRRLRENLAAARSIFGGPDSACRILRCDGAWTALLEYPRYQSEEETVLGLLRDEHLAVQPGFFFDMERDGYLALSLILRPEAFRDGAMRLRRYIDAGDDHKLARTASLK